MSLLRPGVIKQQKPKPKALFMIDDHGYFQWYLKQPISNHWLYKAGVLSVRKRKCMCAEIVGNLSDPISCVGEIRIK